MLALARRVGRLMDGEISSLDSAIEELKTAMLQVIEGADSLRKSTVSKVVEILSPIHSCSVSSSNEKVGIAKGLAKSNN